MDTDTTPSDTRIRTAPTQLLDNNTRIRSCETPGAGSSSWVWSRLTSLCVRPCKCPAIPCASLARRTPLLFEQEGVGLWACGALLNANAARVHVPRQISNCLASDSEIRLGDWQTFQKFGAAGARCVPTMVGRAAKKILRSRQPFLIGKWPLLGAIPLVGAQRSSQAGPAAFPSTYTFRMEAQTQRRAQTKCKSICTKVGRQCQNRGTENGV